MKKTPLMFLASAALIAFTACTGAKNNEAETAVDSVATEVAEVVAPTHIGTYEGTLPCADCDGIKTTLTIKDEQTYDLRSEYLNKKDGLFEESGVYNLVDDGKIIELVTPSAGTKTYYKILENAVVLSDSLGTVNEGELAEMYILKKQ